MVREKVCSLKILFFSSPGKRLVGDIFTIVFLFVQAILCTKELAEKARAAAFNLLVEMGNAALRWSAEESHGICIFLPVVNPLRQLLLNYYLIFVFRRDKFAQFFTNLEDIVSSSLKLEKL